MSQELLAIAPVEDLESITGAPYVSGSLSGVPAVRGQASEIIDAVLGHGAPTDSAAAERLRRHVARNPDQPERALLEHLLETGRLNRAG